MSNPQLLQHIWLRRKKSGRNPRPHARCRIGSGRQQRAASTSRRPSPDAAEPVQSGEAGALEFLIPSSA